MIVRFALSIGALATVLVLLVTQTGEKSESPSAVSVSSISASSARSLAWPTRSTSPVVVPVENSHASVPPSFDAPAESPRDLADVNDAPSVLTASVPTLTALQSVVGGKSGSTASESKAVLVRTIASTEADDAGDDNQIRHNVALDTLAFDDDLTRAAHLLSRSPARSRDLSAAGRLATARFLAVAESSRRLDALPGRDILAKDSEELSDGDKSDSAASDGNTGDGAGEQVKEKAELTPRMQALKTRLETVMSYYRPRLLNTRDRGHWATMHSLIAFGVDKEIRLGGPSGRKVNAIGWIAWNGVLAGERLFYLSNGKIQSRKGPGLQGHHGQYLAIVAQSKVMADYQMKINGKEFTIADLIRREQDTCVPHSELSFKLIGLSHYLDSETKWKDEQGRDWSIARMVKDELGQPIIGAACGGTHRLFGLAYAVKKRVKQGHPIDGQFKRAEKFLSDYQAYTFKLQNPDGSYSTQFFAARGSDHNPAKRLETTGHIAEWLTLLLDDEQIENDRMVKSIEFLSSLLYKGRDREWKVGPLGHGLHALNMYHQRVFGESHEKSMQVASDEEVIRSAAKPTTPRS